MPLGLCLLFWLLQPLRAHAFAGEPAVWSYQPSSLERAWSTNVPEWSNGTIYCSRVMDYERHIDYWLRYTRQLMLTRRLRINLEATNDVFSMFHKSVECRLRTISYSTWIEPLAFCLRHPSAPCNRKRLLDRDYLLLTSIIDLKYSTCGRPFRKFYFDLGASVWNKGAGGASQQMLVEAYRRRGIEFDRLLMWEANKTLTSDLIFSDVPREMLGRYTYYHFPASVNVSDPGNPLNILKRIARVSDFVAFKLDIDNDALESKLVTQILDDPEIYNRIDEFFFEHHVNFEPMQEAWKRIPNATLTLPYSYWLFSELRNRGIRAHGWP